MSTGRKIYCCQCDLYVGTIRDASLMKGITFLCPTHSESPEPDDDNLFSNFTDTLSSFLNTKKYKTN